MEAEEMKDISAEFEGEYEVERKEPDGSWFNKEPFYLVTGKKEGPTVNLIDIDRDLAAERRRRVRAAVAAGALHVPDGGAIIGVLSDLRAKKK